MGLTSMAVLLTNRALAVQKRAEGVVDAHGDAVGGAWGSVLGPWPGRAQEAADGSWRLAVDPAAAPLAPGDLVLDMDTGQSWLATSVSLLRNNYDPTVDYLRVDARERVRDADAAVGTEVPATPQPTTRYPA